MWLFWRGVRNLRAGLPGITLAAGATLPLLLSLFIPFTVEPFYIMALVFPAVAIQGIGITGRDRHFRLHPPLKDGDDHQ